MAALARICFRHRFAVLLLWVAALAGTAVAAETAGSRWANDFELPGTESAEAVELLRESFPETSGDTDSVVWRAPEGGSVRDPRIRARMTEALAGIADVPQVGRVAGPYAPEGGRQISGDGRIAYAQVTFTEQAMNLEKENIEEVIDTARAAADDVDGLQVELGGEAIQAVQGAPGGLAEVTGIVAAVVIRFPSWIRPVSAGWETRRLRSRATGWGSPPGRIPVAAG
ncbi:MMPL family transporter [Streptomyces sp. MAR4 CNX-425]|uniref:MMPL family transporter n=1 Tax=Streptomyces sp. MAR4 CNX-425 TaxID=3406343 RepID=UPI003B5061A5